MRRRNVVIISVSVLLLLLVGGLLIRRQTLGSGPSSDAVSGSVRLLVPWTDTQSQASLRRELSLFGQIYPDVSVELSSQAIGEINQLWREQRVTTVADVSVLSIRVPDDQLTGELLPWTGAIWSLYANRGVLEGTDIWSSELRERFLSGDASLDEFSRLLEQLGDSGVSPVSVGARFVWPFTTWLQHIALLLGSDSGSEDAAALWRTWERNSWLVPDWRAIDWPESLRRVQAGEAALVLLAGTLASQAVSGDSWIIMPFPRGEDGDWTVGSVWSLGVSEGIENPQAAALLVEFLSSQGVTDRLSRAVGTRFFAADRDGTVGRVVASATAEPESPFSRDAAAYLER